MVLTKEIKLLPNAGQRKLLDATTAEYISLVNDILDYAVAIDRMPKLSSANVKAPLPSALRDQCRRDASSIWKKTLKIKGRIPALKKPVAIWNNQNYEVGVGFIAFPLWVDGKTQKTRIKAIVPEDVLALLTSHKLGTLRTTKKRADCSHPLRSGVLRYMGLLRPTMRHTEQSTVEREYPLGAFSPKDLIAPREATPS